MLLALSLGLRGLWSSRLNSLCGVEGGRVLWWQVELEGCRRVRFVCVVVVCECLSVTVCPVSVRCRGAPLSRLFTIFRELDSTVTTTNDL